MATPLELSTRRDPDGTPVVAAVGEIDMSNAARLADMLGVAAPEDGRLVVDLTGVEYLDSAAVKVLYGYASRIRIVASPLLLPVLIVSGLSDIISVHDPQG